MLNTGNSKTTAIMDMEMPAMVPAAKSNQKTSSGPSDRNGINPNTVDMMVRNNCVML